MRWGLSFMCLLASLQAAAVAEPEATGSTRPSAKPRTVRRSVPSRSAEEALQRIESLMDASARRLTDEFDTSTQTQDVQTEVIEAIDDAIRAAVRQQGGSGKSKQSKGESRSAGRRAEQKPGRGDGRPTDKPPSKESTQSGQGGGPAPSSAPGDRADVRRGWGYLPQRDRQAIMQGSQEEFLAKYREQIERYYRAIAERAEEGR